MPVQFESRHVDDQLKREDGGDAFKAIVAGRGFMEGTFAPASRSRLALKVSSPESVVGSLPARGPRLSSNDSGAGVGRSTVSSFVRGADGFFQTDRNRWHDGDPDPRSFISSRPPDTRFSVVNFSAAAPRSPLRSLVARWAVGDPLPRDSTSVAELR